MMYGKASKYRARLGILLYISLLLIGCSNYLESPQYISYAIENIEEAKEFFKKEQITLDIREEDETTYLEVTSALDEVYLYRDSSYFDRLYKIEKEVSYEQKGEIKKRQLIMVVQDEELARVMPLTSSII